MLWLRGFVRADVYKLVSTERTRRGVVKDLVDNLCGNAVPVTRTLEKLDTAMSINEFRHRITASLSDPVIAEIYEEEGDTVRALAESIECAYTIADIMRLLVAARNDV